MKRFAQVVIIALIFFLFTSFVFGAGMTFGGSDFVVKPNLPFTEDRPAELNIFWQAWDIVHKRFVDREALEPTKLTYGAIRGMVEALGDEGHSTFLTPEQFSHHQTATLGEFSGIGAQVGVKNHLPVIVAPFDGSPAQQAGVQAGDIILEVDGQDVTTLPLNEIVERIRGPEGTQVVLTVFRPDKEESMEISIVRGVIEVPAATWTMIPETKIALIRLSQFSLKAEDDVVNTISEAKSAGATGLIVDVRNNPGGLLDQAIKVTSQFLKEGNVLLQEDAQGHRQAFPVREGGIAQDMPLVVLINQGSASAAEIFAGAVQDHQRGLLVGETTFGTGTVLETFRLRDGSALLLGTSQWLTPKGRVIRQQGIEPDITVELPFGTNLLAPGDLEALDTTELWSSEDTQLLKALEVLGIQPPEKVMPVPNSLIFK